MFSVSASAPRGATGGVHNSKTITKHISRLSNALQKLSWKLKGNAEKEIDEKCLNGALFSPC